MPEICDNILLLPVGNYSLLYFLMQMEILFLPKLIKSYEKDLISRRIYCSDLA